MSKQLITKRKPTSVGEMLLEEFLEPQGRTVEELASHIGETVEAVDKIIKDEALMSATFICKVAAAFGTSTDFWFNLQKMNQRWNIENAKEEVSKEISAFC